MAAWGTIAKVESINLDEIMSEEFARDLQDKENKRYGDLIYQEVAAKEKPADDIPQEVLNALKDDGIEADSDTIIAQVLQAQFDMEYNEEIKRLEKHQNKDAKITISLSKYRMAPDELLYDSEEDEIFDPPKKDWDRFEKNERQFSSIPRSGYKIDEEGQMITKHDPAINGVRNACKVMSFPPEFLTGDGAGFDMKLSNSVFNQLKTFSRNTKKTNKKHDRKDNVATAEMGIDEPTRILLFKMINNQILEQINGIIATGKEAIVLHAQTDASTYEGDLNLPKECAIKIFKTTLNEFKQRDRYIKDDYRFRDRFSKQNKRAVINMWAEKEMHNLMRMHNIGIPCPEVVVLKKNILVMSFLGENGQAARKLKDAVLSEAELIMAYDDIEDMMCKLYREARLVHADLSEYNILWHLGKCWLIDVAQSIEPDHPSAKEYLMRDCNNISTVSSLPFHKSTKFKF